MVSTMSFAYIVKKDNTRRAITPVKAEQIQLALSGRLPLSPVQIAYLETIDRVVITKPIKKRNQLTPVNRLNDWENGRGEL